ncbi:hypothetical protein C0J00_02500 [Streptococcus pluranimalium]|uniref:Uncharacterized protein n=1 Tax=Streptococcus pluranimalium TaxID=82348 RepID=A0A2L0D6P7_9STRE|nr:hypothetical protein C0J00_02500 [Streptococcus pluranimalium]
MKEKGTLTKRQQDNVVRWIARGYDVDKVKFLNCEKNTTTGTYSLIFRIDDKTETSIVQVESLKEFDDSNGDIGLDPIEDFIDLEKSNPLDNDEPVNISDIEITYLGE